MITVRLASSTEKTVRLASAATNPKRSMQRETLEDDRNRGGRRSSRDSENETLESIICELLLLLLLSTYL